MDFCYIKSVTLKLLKGMAGRKSRRVKRRGRRNNITIKRVQRGGGRGRRRSRRGRKRNQVGGGAAMPLLILGSMLAPVIEKSLGGLINKI